MPTSANIEDPDEMLRFVAFHQGIYFKDNLQRKKYNFYLEIITCDPSNYMMDHLKFIVSNQKE